MIWIVVGLAVLVMLATNQFPGRGTYWKNGWVSFNEGGTLGFTFTLGYPVEGQKDYWFFYVAVGFIKWWKRKHWKWGGACLGCEYKFPYGFVPEAGCPVHDPE